MAVSKVAISLDAETLRRLDLLVKQGVFPSRSRAIQSAIQEKLSRLDRRRLAQECAKLDSDYEQTLAEERMVAEAEPWPEY